MKAQNVVSKLPKKLSEGEEMFYSQFKNEGSNDLPDREYTFHPMRKFRFDFAWPKYHVAVEIEGGVWHGRHTSGIGFEKDCEKYNLATVNNWKVLRFTTKQVKDGTAFVISKAFLSAIKYEIKL